MARIYNTRQLLDPSMIQYISNRADQNVAFDKSLRDKNTENIRNLLLQGGKTAKDIRQQNERENEVSLWDLPNDPVARAAREEYIRTGSSSPLMSYQMQKLAAEQRAADEQSKMEAAKRSKALHDAVTLRDDRNKHNEYQSLMFKAMDEGRLADAQAYKEKMTGLENFYKENYPEFENPFGGSAQSMWDARQQEMNTRKDQDIAEQNRQYEVAKFISTIPKIFAKEDDKKPYYEQINNNEFLNQKEKTELLKDIRNIEAGDTSMAKAKQNAKSAHGGKKTTEDLENADAKAKAKKYIGQKMNSLEWLDIPDDVRALLTRNGQNVVGWKE